MQNDVTDGINLDDVTLSDWLEEEEDQTMGEMQLRREASGSRDRASTDCISKSEQVRRQPSQKRHDTTDTVVNATTVNVFILSVSLRKQVRSPMCLPGVFFSQQIRKQSGFAPWPETRFRIGRDQSIQAFDRMNHTESRRTFSDLVIPSSANPKLEMDRLGLEDQFGSSDGRNENGRTCDQLQALPCPVHCTHSSDFASRTTTEDEPCYSSFCHCDGKFAPSADPTSVPATNDNTFSSEQQNDVF
jgi:hypothetical protein